MGWAHTHMDKNLGGLSWEQGVPSPHQTSPAQDSRKCQEDKSPQLLNQQGLSCWRRLLEPLSNSSWGTHTQTHLLRLTPSELQHWGGILKGTSGIQGETEVSGIGSSRGHCPFAEPTPHRASRLVPHLRTSTWLTKCDLPWRSIEALPHPTYGPTQAAFL